VDLAVNQVSEGRFDVIFVLRQRGSSGIARLAFRVSLVAVLRSLTTSAGFCGLGVLGVARWPGPAAAGAAAPSAGDFLARLRGRV
jgi:hypothetical protein